LVSIILCSNFVLTEFIFSKICSIKYLAIFGLKHLFHLRNICFWDFVP